MEWVKRGQRTAQEAHLVSEERLPDEGKKELDEGSSVEAVEKESAGVDGDCLGRRH